ncbi:MAG: LysR family transcriptional regulator [Alphaproteobacteria bacterium]|jgi:predicted thioesterase|nr:LysR family transcriptional regulator [Rhodospirillaceae bacterium]MDP6407548.1 LysR family transcriptional regulator [Alphaproteobacteria bacterium]MDP6623526.1 LysR family transcriptional regulator [Alphaproteobacteria bacterium]HJP21260.1 LysR family transcriptional regulator [Alphaproteobacteria bacterium]|tara:strand:- start:3693 stop:4100 length:408 start_codon:yes stop_codon:yes gene_type:complete
MKESLKPGVSASKSFKIDKERTIDFMGEDLRVYATPMLVRDIEHTCRDLIVEHCEAGEDSVGTHVDLAHTGATPLGMTVEITVTIGEVKGRHVTLEVSAKDDVEDVASGKHSRFVVDMAKTKERLTAKVAKVTNA